MKEEKKEQVKEYLLKNIETLKDVVRELHSWDGSLEDLNYYQNDEYFFKEMFSETDEAVRAVCYGDYNYMDDYVKFNAYGNLDSCSELEYEEDLKNNIDEIIDTLEENIENVNICDEILKNIIESEE